jgi:hypothetical protein
VLRIDAHRPISLTRLHGSQYDDAWRPRRAEDSITSSRYDSGMGWGCTMSRHNKAFTASRVETLEDRLTLSHLEVHPAAPIGHHHTALVDHRHTVLARHHHAARLRHHHAGPDAPVAGPGAAGSTTGSTAPVSGFVAPGTGPIAPGPGSTPPVPAPVPPAPAPVPPVPAPVPPAPIASTLVLGGTVGGSTGLDGSGTVGPLEP